MMPMVRYPRHADDLSLCLDHTICDRVHLGRPEDYPMPAREPQAKTSRKSNLGVLLRKIIHL